MENDRRRDFAFYAFPLFLLATLVILYLFRAELVALFRDREVLRRWVEAKGAGGMLAFVGLQALQVVLFVVPGEVVQVAGGYIYGLWGGSVLSLLGITCGAAFNFAVGRLLGRPFVESVFKKERIEAIERLTSTGRAAAGFFLLFVIPGIPKDALCYVAGMSRLSLPLFFAVSMVGRLPGILGSSLMGSAAYDGAYGTALVLLAIASVLFFLGLVFRERIELLLARLIHRTRDGGIV